VRRHSQRLPFDKLLGLHVFVPAQQCLLSWTLTLLERSPRWAGSCRMAGVASAVLLQVINSQKIVCPTREELLVEHGDYVCPSEGCDKVFPVSSQLQMHMTRHHHGLKLTGTAGSEAGGSLSRDCVYYCPVEGCPRIKSNGQPFPRLGQLKQVCTYDNPSQTHCHIPSHSLKP
jgi:hypothetical protein